MPPRRDAGRPRGEPIERAILEATLEELATHGLEGLSIPRVAKAVDVNKTSVYRRWSTKEDLVRAALEAAMLDTAAEVVDSGSLVGDLRQVARAVANRLQSPGGRALVAAAMADSMAPFAHALRAEQLVGEASGLIALVRRAVDRGEWDLARCPPDVVLTMLTGSVFHRVLMEHQPVTEAWVDGVVGVVAAGVRGGS